MKRQQNARALGRRAWVGRAGLWLLAGAAGAGAPALATGCETFDPPPEGSLGTTQLEGAPGDPFVLTFSETIVRSTLRIEIVRADQRLDLDPEGFLPDEEGFCEYPRSKGECQADPPAPCCTNPGKVVLMSYDGASGASMGGSFTLEGRELTIDPDDGVLQLAVPYLLVIEPGLEDPDGNRTVPRQKLELSYPDFVADASSLPTGPYFFLFDIAPPPLQTQLRLFAWLEVDADTGEWTGLFTDGNRTEVLDDRPGCPSCGDNACKLFPGPPECVRPSTNIGSIEEWRDLVPIKDRPVGFTFLGAGFSADQPDGSIAFATPPFPIDIVIGSGEGTRITAYDTEIAALVTQDEDGRWRGAGGASIGRVAVNDLGNSQTTAALSFMTLTPEEQALAENCGHEEPLTDGRPCEPIYKPGDI